MWGIHPLKKRREIPPFKKHTILVAIYLGQPHSENRKCTLLMATCLSSGTINAASTSNDNQYFQSNNAGSFLSFGHLFGKLSYIPFSQNTSINNHTKYNLDGRDHGCRRWSDSNFFFCAQALNFHGFSLGCIGDIPVNGRPCSDKLPALLGMTLHVASSAAQVTTFFFCFGHSGQTIL